MQRQRLASVAILALGLAASLALYTWARSLEHAPRPSQPPDLSRLAPWLPLTWHLPLSSPIRSSAPSARPLVRLGFTYPLWSPDAYGKPEAEAALRELAATHANAVALVPTWLQDDRAASRVYPLARTTPMDEALARAVATAHGLGLRVLLKPHVDAVNGDWRGDFRPRDVAAWFATYRAFILAYADFAERYGVEELSVGCELQQITGPAQRARWAALIAEVRQRFHGQLTYSANWTEFADLSFWDLLDYAGIDAYFPLLADPQRRPTYDEVVAGWSGGVGPRGEPRNWLAEIDAWQARISKPVVLTELGYANQLGVLAHPWDSAGSQVPDPATQEVAYRAALEVFGARPYFAGVFIWAWETTQPDGPADLRMTPQGKPALATISAYFQRRRTEG